MEEPMKGKYLILLAAAVLSVFSLTASVLPGGGTTDIPRTISVSGTGKVYLTPDIATINVGVHTEDVDVGKALSDNTAAAQNVADALKGFGVDEKDIQTTNFSIYPNQTYGPAGEMLGIKYMVDNTVMITVRDLAKLGEILSSVVNEGANNIYGITFDVSDRTKALDDARKAAIADARLQADELAAAAGVTVGQVMSISVSNTSQPQPYYNMGYGGGGGMAASAPAPVSSGQLIVTADAYITYEMK
jgi:uncharacterized protein YggE